MRAAKDPEFSSAIHRCRERSDIINTVQLMWQKPWIKTMEKSGKDI